MGRIEVITRTERRRKYSPAERAAIMREADAPDVTVREVAKRHDIAESLIYSCGRHDGRRRRSRANRWRSSLTGRCQKAILSPSRQRHHRCSPSPSRRCR